jgi:HSP90 family molecular chaperone
MIEDSANRARLSKLLRFTSSKSDGEAISLEQYIARMKKGQTKIYYIAGESEELLKSSPLLERLTRRGYEVLYWTDPLDEYMASSFTEFDGKKLINISKEGDLEIESEEEKEKEKELAEEFKDLAEYLKKTLSKKISKAVVSSRLAKSPSAIVSSGYGYTANMERILKAQALNQQQSTYMAPRKVMEINPRHPIIQELHRRVAASEDDPDAKVIAEVLYDTAALNSGFSIDDPSDFATRIHRMMKLSLQLDAELEAELEPEAEVEAEAEAEAEADEVAEQAGEAIEEQSAEL